MKSKKGPVVGAIQRALRLKIQEDYENALVAKVKDELFAHGVHAFFNLHGLETPQKFLARLKKNKKLREACKSSIEWGVTIHLKEKFDELAGVVYVDSEASDDEIVKFLTK
jgi:hypothetical protein